MEDLPKRLLELHSIYMTGWSLQPDHKKYPTTLFAERPNCYWYTQYTVSGPDAMHEHPQFVSTYLACNGHEELRVFVDDKKAWVDNMPPIASELSTEQIFQHQVLPALLDGSRGDFVKTGSEMVGDTRCDVYEGRWVFKTRVWFDPRSGLPMQIAYYGVAKTGQEEMHVAFDHIEVNVSAAEKGLSFAVPEDYQVTRNDEANPLNRLGSSKNSLGKLTSGYYLNIDEKAVLVCWACDTGSGEKMGHGEVTFMLGQNRECNNTKMATVNINGREWNWSLVSSKEKEERIGSDGLKVFPFWDKSRKSSVQYTPLRFPEKRLRSIIEEIQLATKTVPEGGKPFTLDMLRATLVGR